MDTVLNSGRCLRRKAPQQRRLPAVSNFQFRGSVAPLREYVAAQGRSAGVVVWVFFEFHGVAAAGDVAHAGRIAILDHLKLDAARLAAQYLTRLDRFH
jgi:hypothetical protein